MKTRHFCVLSKQPIENPKVYTNNKKNISF